MLPLVYTEIDLIQVHSHVRGGIHAPDAWYTSSFKRAFNKNKSMDLMV